MTKFVENALELGGKVVLGGERLARTGHFFAPTVVTDLPEHSMLMTEEPFGPIAPITRFSDTDDVIRRANSLPFGLSSYVFTNRSEEHTSELQSLMRNSYAVFCLKKKNNTNNLP